MLVGVSDSSSIGSNLLGAEDGKWLETAEGPKLERDGFAVLGSEDGDGLASKNGAPLGSEDGACVVSKTGR